MKWQYWGQQRPPFAQDPKPGEESVWDYPRPPRVEPTTALVEVQLGAVRIATRAALRVLETAGPPTYYLPPVDGCIAALRPVPQQTWCEWKGTADYWALAAMENGEAVAWCYPQPTPDYRMLAGYLSFYPGRVACFVDGERVRPQGGGYYGGWVTDAIIGPWKGEPGSADW